MTRPARPTDSPYAPAVADRELTAVSADGSRLHVELHGPEGAPAVVLVHGWTCSTLFWAPVIRELLPDHRVVVYDQRGHGRSPAPGPSGYSTTALADDLEAVLAATLSPGERAVVAGHSMGGMTLMAAAGRPFLAERAAAVLLANTGSARLVPEAAVVPLRPGRLRTALQGALLGSTLPLGPVTALSRALLKYGTMGPRASREQSDAVARVVHACPRKVRGLWAKKVLAVLDVHANLARLTVPAAVLTGSADRLTPPVLSQRIVEALPVPAGLTSLPGLGHMTPVEAPDKVAGVIRGLVRDHLTGTAAGEGTLIKEESA
ncbi:MULTISPECIES: alpha/beta fold hydrolase [Streptomyces]|uniref:Alpha/beta hydrolase n=1 Tax=Streptomyces lycii TaxID=2654337 RepID=A0ABQ7FAW2_9ACTN|nr:MULTISPECIES: alpha/beta hydrolase [Streptomyces]KAF4405380.1 alpha/beta hydrolase [Streptomyces lycii]PGH49929.1 alpha/beta hydrolase [Streptomyces sp. Ru87]